MNTLYTKPFADSLHVRQSHECGHCEPPIPTIAHEGETVMHITSWLSNLFAAKRNRHRPIGRLAAASERLEARTLLAANMTLPLRDLLAENGGDGSAGFVM